MQQSNLIHRTINANNIFDINAAMTHTPDVLISQILQAATFRNLTIDETSNGNYLLILSYEQMQFKKCIKNLEDCGAFNTISYSDDSISIEFNEEGNDVFLKLFLTH